MRVLALSTRRTLSLLRRVVAPFSVLSTRGHTFYFQEVSSFDPTISYGYDVVLLQNWIMNDEEFALYQQVAEERSFVYDLSDPALLEFARVQRQLRYARVVTVPNSFLAREVKQLARRVVELPSCIDFPLMMTGRNYGKSDDVKVIGCFGPHDWYLVKEAIQHFKNKHPKVIFLGDFYAEVQLGDLIQKVELDYTTYPGYLHSCLFGLCPYDGDKGQEHIWGLEYGILCKPIVANKGSLYTDVLPDRSSNKKDTPCAQYVPSSGGTEAWVTAMDMLYRDAWLRSTIGQQAYLFANEWRATKLASEYLWWYEKTMPQLQIG